VRLIGRRARLVGPSSNGTARGPGGPCVIRRDPTPDSAVISAVEAYRRWPHSWLGNWAPVSPELLGRTVGQRVVFRPFRPAVEELGVR